jgi:hypothetical protein
VLASSDYKKLEKMLNHLWARENHWYFSEKTTDNGKCTMQDEKGQDIQLEMVLPSRSKDT